MTWKYKVRMNGSGSTLSTFILLQGNAGFSFFRRRPLEACTSGTCRAKLFSRCLVPLRQLDPLPVPNPVCSQDPKQLQEFATISGAYRDRNANRERDFDLGLLFVMPFRIQHYPLSIFGSDVRGMIPCIQEVSGRCGL